MVKDAAAGIAAGVREVLGQLETMLQSGEAGLGRSEALSRLGTDSLRQWLG